MRDFSNTYFTCGIFRSAIFKASFMGLIALMVFISVTPTKALEFAASRVWHIPVVINVYKNSISNDKAKQIIDKANELLKQAGIRLEIVTGPKDSNAGDADNDGKISGDEVDKVFTEGSKEIRGDGTPGSGLRNRTGLKVSFVINPEKEDEDTVGLAEHRVPTVLIKGSLSVDNGGETLAHEVGHLLTIKKHSDDADHIMKAEGFGGTKFTKEQIKEMRQMIWAKAKCSTQFKRAFPAKKCDCGRGAAVDEKGDQEPGEPEINDLDQVMIVGFEEEDEVRAHLLIWGILPTDEHVDVIYYLGFNVDNNILTGISFAGLDGIDRIVAVTASGCFDCGTFFLTGEVSNTNDGNITPLPTTPVMEIEMKYTDFNDKETPARTSVLFTVPKDLINISNSTQEVPTVVAAGNGVMIFDILHTIYEPTKSDQDPTLTTFDTGIPEPGQPYPFTVSGLEPNSPFNLLLNGEPVLSSTLDATGTYSGQFEFPLDLSNETAHFLTAQDETGEFAYNSTCPKLEYPDQLHVTGPQPNMVPIESEVAVSASVQGNFKGIPGENLVFTKVLGDFSFNSGRVSADGNSSTTGTNLFGEAEIRITGERAGLGLVKVTVENTPLNAYSVIFFQ